MVIRCERCSTLYELDEALLAPDGSPVQCTRCEHVFTARPPSPAGPVEERVRALDPVRAEAAETAEAAAPPTSEPTSRPPDEPAAAYDRPTPTPPPEPGPRAPAQEARHARGPAPSVYRPTPGPGTVRAHPQLRRDAVGAFESRLRSTARLRRLAPAAALGLVVLAAGAGWLLLRGRGTPAGSAPEAGLSRAGAPDQPAPVRAVPSTGGELPQAPYAQPPATPLPGNDPSPSEKTVSQDTPAAASSEPAPLPLAAENPPQPGPGAAAQMPHPAVPPSGALPGSVPAPARGAPASALVPAALPDISPASGMPQIAPSGVPEGAHPGAREPAAFEEPIGGG